MLRHQHYSDSSTTKLKAELEQLNAETKTKGEKLRFYQENDEDISPEELQNLKNELKALTNEEASLTKECEASKKFTPEYLQKLDQDKVCLILFLLFLEKRFRKCASKASIDGQITFGTSLLSSRSEIQPKPR